MTDSPDIETVERTIAAPPEQIFELLARPGRHHEIDGSGAVRDSKHSPDRVKLGDTFGMSMKLGVPYSSVNTVVEFEDNRRIAWQTRFPTAIGKMVGGRIWRYELEPVDGGTRVRESWDISHERWLKPLMRMDRTRQHTREAMEATLEKMEKLVANS